MAVGVAAIRIDSATGSDDEVRLLARWLRDEDELRGRVELERGQPQPGDMGGVGAAVVVVVTSGTMSVVVRSLFDWLARRRAAEQVTLTLKSAAGNEIDLACGSAADAEKLIDRCQQFFEG